MIFNCKEDNVVPKDFMTLVEAGGIVQVMTSIGWITIEEDDGLEFRNSLTYQVLESK